jgi:hypothetical protein
MYKDGGTNVRDEERSGWPSVVSDDQKICERRLLIILELSCEFPHISPVVLYDTNTVRPGCHKLCARWVQKMFTGAHKTQRMASALNFLERYHKDGDEFFKNNRR